jgi:hypothetical protein
MRIAAATATAGFPGAPGLGGGGAAGGGAAGGGGDPLSPPSAADVVSLLTGVFGRWADRRPVRQPHPLATPCRHTLSPPCAARQARRWPLSRLPPARSPASPELFIAEYRGTLASQLLYAADYDTVRPGAGGPREALTGRSGWPGKDTPCARAGNTEAPATRPHGRDPLLGRPPRRTASCARWSY